MTGRFATTGLPRVASLPFTALGHQVLFDYDRYARTVWYLALNLKRDLERIARLHDGIIVLAAAVLLLIWFVVGYYADAYLGGLAPAAVVSVAIVFFGMRAIARAPCSKRVLIARIEAVEALLTGTFSVPDDFSFPDLPKTDFITWGNGIFEPDSIPVILASEYDRFAGFGVPLAEQSFVCARQKDVSNEFPSEKHFSERILEGVSDIGRLSGFGPTQSGQALLVDADSIRWHSLLIESHRPRHTVSRAELSRLVAGEDGVECRVHWVTMVIFPRYLSTATVFIRPFISGRAGCCEVVLNLLGPPTATERLLRTRLLNLKRAHASKGGKRGASKFLRARLGPLALELDSFYEKDEPEPSVIRMSRKKWKARNHKDERGLSIIEKNLLQETDRWVGDWTRFSVDREYQSYVLTPDVFGQTEVKAAVRGLFLEISDCVLRAMEEMGFDVSAYRDDKGRLTVSAEKIDSLVVGERVTVQRSEPAEKASAAKKKAEPG